MGRLPIFLSELPQSLGRLRTGGDLNFAASFDCYLKDNRTDITITLETKLNILKSNAKIRFRFLQSPNRPFTR